jgi:O-antigen biosynthesis protein
LDLISVIIPTYNRPDVLMNRCIPSVLAQTYANWECHVVGDGTDDKTVLAMMDLVARDSRFRFTNLAHYDYGEENTWPIIGLPPLNYGLDNALGDWIAVIGDDDAWTPDHHEALLAAAKDSGADHVYGLSDTIKNGQVTGQLYGSWPPGDGQLCNGANLYRASLGYRYDLDCRSRGRTGDADLWLRMVEGGVKWHFLRQIVHHYHRNWP